MRYALVLLATLGCAATPPISESPKPPPAKKSDEPVPVVMPVAMRFAWPVPGLVLVSEKVRKSDVDAELRYELHICKTAAGATVRHRDLEFTSLGGVPADDPRVAAAVQQASALTSAFPDLVIAGDGSFVGIEGWERVKKASIALLADASRPEIEAMLNDPLIDAMMQAKAGERWSAWVTTWMAYEPRGPREQPFVYEDETGGGEDVEFLVDRVAVEGDKLRLRTSSTQNREQLGSGVDAIFGAIAKQVPGEDLERVFDQMQMTRTVTWEVLTDPRTLMPSEARTEMLLAAEIPGKLKRSKEEHHHYTFDWSSKKKPSCP